LNGFFAHPASPFAGDRRQLAVVGEGTYNRELAAMRERGIGFVHEGGQLSYGAPGGREQFWAALPPAVRDRLAQIVGGQLTEWWAHRAGDGSHMAVVLGSAALCQADPAVKPDGLPGHRVRTARFVPGSLRVTASGDPASGSPGSGQMPGGAAPPVLGGVFTTEFRSFLGNLPPSTQVELQRPFAPKPDLRYSFYYQDNNGSPHTWIGLCYIADEQRLTFASTTRVIAPSGSTQSWHATCYQARLAGPMPAP
jgi:hypothetical protein